MPELNETCAAIVRTVRATCSLAGRQLRASGGLVVVSIMALFLTMTADGDLLGMSLGTVMLPTSQKGAFDVADSSSVQADSANTSDTLEVSKFTGRVGIVDAYRLPLLKPAQLKNLDSETIWLARAIYSETKRPEEQELVAWVVRNRVETRFRGKSTYQEAVLDPYQFSAFIEGTSTRRFYSNLTPMSKYPGWQRALAIAYAVRTLPAYYRPFSIKTRHFYSEQSMVGKSAPDWANGKYHVVPNRDFALDERRFRFYEGIS